MLEELRRQQEETKARILKSFGYDDAEAIPGSGNQTSYALIKKNGGK